MRVVSCGKQINNLLRKILLQSGEKAVKLGFTCCHFEIKKPKNMLHKSIGANFISNAAKLNVVVLKQLHSMTGLVIFTPSGEQGEPPSFLFPFFHLSHPAHSTTT